MSQSLKTTEPIPGYVVKDRIGVGGYGEVWSVQAPGGLAKAIKFVYGYFDDARAARELKALERIKTVRHPFLLSLERFEVVDNQLLIVTELADGSLKDRFEQLKNAHAQGIPRDELLGYIRDAAEALDYMSENFSLQHLDVKPENLLLVGGRVKVADFGLVKDLADTAASMMGGLTPTYAAPEVYDDRPTPNSDQYSLAIVYQEMLTGTLPFPGRTTAQLASQHLHARPRLSSLSPADQAVIGKALSKKPQDRYPSCRAMVENLIHGAKPTPRPLAGGPSRAPAPPAKNEAAAHRPRPGSADADAPQPRSDGDKTQVFDSESHRGWTTQPAVGLAPLAEPNVDLPPLEPSDIQVEAELRPTLFVGVGGTACQVLRGLRQRLRDALGAPATVPAFQTLLIDTDPKHLYQATEGDRDTALTDHETIAVPLKAAHEYANDSRDILRWLSRRWLYNIPRSLETEGRRPLGRLALVDHSQQVFQRLQAQLTEMTSDAAIEASSQATGRKFAAAAPRVFLIASISGGAGSGMILDLAYAVRTLLTDLELSEDGVCGILMHSTDRNPQTHDLAIANTVACLSELNHFSLVSNYPGDAACGLPAFPAGDRTFPHAYMVHLGDNLNDDELAAATDRVASYLHMCSAGGASPLLDTCRTLTTDDGVPTLRSFATTALGGMQTGLPDDATNQVCRDLVRLWRDGQPKPMLAEEVDADADDAATADAVQLTPIEKGALELAEATNLTCDALGDQVAALVEARIGGSADTVLARVRGMAQRKTNAGGATKAIVQSLGTMFGVASADDDSPAVSHLRQGLEQDVRPLAATAGTAIRRWILDLVEQPDARVGGAAQARQWFATHLKELETAANTLRTEARQRVQTYQKALVELDHAPHALKLFFGARRADRAVGGVDAALADLVRLHIEEVAWHAVGRLTRSITAEVAAAGDQIKELQQQLGQLGAKFPVDTPLEDVPASAQPGVAEQVQAALVKSLRQRLPQIVGRVDQRVQETELAPHGGMQAVCRKSDLLGEGLCRSLHAIARDEVLAAIREISLVGPLLGSGDDTEAQLGRIQNCLNSAQSKFSDCGGARRLLAILPRTADKSPLVELLREKLVPPATVGFDAGADVHLLYELERLPIKLVAGRLTESRNDFAEIAGRLHTRVDVEWSDLL